MHRSFSLVLALAALAGCSNKPASAVPELGARVVTVDEYVAKPDLRKKVSAVCRNDPGSTALDANCVNVQQAEHIAGFGTSIPRLFP